MKKALIALFLGLKVCVSFAQTTADSSKHLPFKGVPLDGTLDLVGRCFVFSPTGGAVRLKEPAFS